MSLVSTYPPVISRDELIPRALVKIAPGKSICWKVRPCRRKPCPRLVPERNSPTISPRRLMLCNRVNVAPGASTVLKIKVLWADTALARPNATSATRSTFSLIAPFEVKCHGVKRDAVKLHTQDLTCDRG